MPNRPDLNRTVAAYLDGLVADATGRQRNTAQNLACEWVEFEGHVLTALQAVVLDGELVRRSHETLAPPDYQRRSRLYAEIMAAHNAVVRADVAARVAAAQSRKVA